MRTFIKSLEMKKNLAGALDVALFMPSGARRFSSDKRAFKLSFLVPLALLPLTLITVLAAHPSEALAPGSAEILMTIYGLRFCISLGLFLGVVYFMAKSMDRLDAFYRFGTANNWLSVPAATLTLPLIVMFLGGHYTWAEIYPFMVLITLYAYGYTAYMASRVLRLPLEMGGFVAIIGMAINQTSLDILKRVAVEALYLVS